MLIWIARLRRYERESRDRCHKPTSHLSPRARLKSPLLRHSDERSSIPKGLPRSAQGCEARSFLGMAGVSPALFGVPPNRPSARQARRLIEDCAPRRRRQRPRRSRFVSIESFSLKGVRQCLGRPRLSPIATSLPALTRNCSLPHWKRSREHVLRPSVFPLQRICHPTTVSPRRTVALPTTRELWTIHHYRRTKSARWLKA